MIGLYLFRFYSQFLFEGVANIFNNYGEAALVELLWQVFPLLFYSGYLLLFGGIISIILEEYLAKISKALLARHKSLRTRRNLNPCYLGLEPKIVKNWPNKW